MNGTPALVILADIAAGDDCAQGGVPLTTGQDSDGDDALSEAETLQQTVVCNGDAEEGALDADGVRALLDARGYLDIGAVNALLDASSVAILSLVDARGYRNSAQVQSVVATAGHVAESDVIARVDTHVQTLHDTVDDLADQLDQARDLRMPFLLGPSSIQTTGAIESGGQVGLAVANGLCTTTYSGEPDVHLCSYGDLTRAIGARRWTLENTLLINNTAGRVLSSIATTQGQDVGKRGSMFHNCQDFLEKSRDGVDGTTATVRLGYQPPNSRSGLRGNVVNMRQGVGFYSVNRVWCCR
jgi:hypothetical protein